MEDWRRGLSRLFAKQKGDENRPMSSNLISSSKDHMVLVTQLVEDLTVNQVGAGSNPVLHPIGFVFYVVNRLRGLGLLGVDTTYMIYGEWVCRG